MLDIVQALRCVSGNDLPFAGRAFIIGVVRQLEVGLAVRLGQPHHDLVFAVDEAEGAVAVVNNRPDQRCVGSDDLVVGRSDGFGHQVPVVIRLVLDGHAVTRVVDDDLIAVFDFGSKDKVVGGFGVYGLLGDDLDSAFAVDVGVVRAKHTVGGLDGGIGEALCIVGQNQIVFHDIVLDQLGAVEHIEAVAHVAQGVVVASQVILGFGIDGNVLAQILVVDLDVLHTVVTGGSAGPDLALLLDSAGDVAVDFIGHAGDLQETAVFANAHILGAPFQSVDDLLAGDGHEAGHVAEGMNSLAGLVGDVALGQIRTDAAAVHHGQVAVEAFGLVEQIIQRVSGEVAQVGLLRTDQAGALVVLDAQIYVVGGDLLAQHIVNLLHPVVLDGLGGCIGAGVVGNQLGLDAVGGNAHAANGVKVAAGLGQNDLVALGVVHFLHLHGAVGVAVDESVQTGGVGNDLLGGVVAGGGINAQVTQCDDIIRAGFLGGVDAVLHSGVQPQAVAVSLAVSVDAIEPLGLIFVHEVGGSGLGNGFGGGDADHGDLLAADLENLVSIEDVLFVLAAIEVAGQVGEVGLAYELQRTSHAVVELMVAQSGCVITGGVHQLDDGSALVHCAVSGALHMVAGVQQQSAGSDRSGLLLQIGNVVIGQRVVDVGMDVVGVVNDDLAVVGQLVAAVGADAIFIVVTQGRNFFGLGLAAHGAGVGLHAGLGAGGFLGDLPLVPYMHTQNGVVETGGHGCHFAAQCVGLGQNENLVAFLAALHDALGGSPLHGVDCVRGNRGAVRIGGQIGAGAHILLHVILGKTIQERGQLLTGHVVVGTEGAVIVALGNAGLCSPFNIGLEPVVFADILEGALVCGGLGLTGKAPEDRGHFGTSQLVRRTETAVRIAGQQVIVYAILYACIEPVAFLNVGEFHFCCKRSGKQCQHHGNREQDSQKPTGDLCVHSEFSFYHKILPLGMEKPALWHSLILTNFFAISKPVHRKYAFSPLIFCPSVVTASAQRAEAGAKSAESTEKLPLKRDSAGVCILRILAHGSIVSSWDYS